MKRILFICCILCWMPAYLSACGGTDASELAMLTPQPIESTPASDNMNDGDAAVNDTVQPEDSSYSEGSGNEAGNVDPESNLNANTNTNTTADSYVGEYNDEAINEPNLEIQKNGDGSYTIQIGIFRLTKLYDCIGHAVDDRIEFTTTEWGDDKEIKGIVRLEGDVATVTFTEGWSSYSFGDITEYKYHKTSDVPNVSAPVSNVNLNTYVGEYNDHDNNEPNLEIQQKDDGTYMIQIGIFRLIWLQDCTGYATDNGIVFSSTSTGEEISGTIALEGNVATVSFTAGWTWEPSEYRYYKTSDIPNIYVP